MKKLNLSWLLLGSLCIPVVIQPAFAADQPVKTEYTIKKSIPEVGTNFKSVIVNAGTIPLDKHYDQLSADEIRDLKSNYNNMPDADEPPFPVNGLMPIYKAIGAWHENAQLKFKGKLRMYVLIDSEGNPKSVSVDESPEEGVTKATAYVLMMQKFKPAVCSGKPCSMEFPISADLVGPDEQDVNYQSPSILITK